MLKVRISAQYSTSGPARAVDLSQLSALQDPEMQQLMAGGSGKNGVLSVLQVEARTRLLAMLTQQVVRIVRELGLPCGSVLHLGDVSYACTREWVLLVVECIGMGLTIGLSYNCAAPPVRRLWHIMMS